MPGARSSSSNSRAAAAAAEQGQNYFLLNRSGNVHTNGTNTGAITITETGCV